MKRIFTLLFIFIITVLNLSGQTWKRYNIASNTTTYINYTVTSTSASNNTNGNRGIISSNLSSDTIRNFNNTDLVNDPNAFPWRMTVKFGNVTGVLIDPYHVLTAGHTVSLNASFGTTKFIPAYSLSDMPFGYAYPEIIYLPNNYAVSSATDYAIIKLDRPLGSLTGWVGYGYNTNSSFYLNSNTFFNPSYPSAGNYNGELLYNWKGKLDYITSEYAYSFRTGIVGMSGSPLFTSINNDLITFGVLTSTGIKFNKLTAAKFDAINIAISNDLPAAFDIAPLTLNAYPKTLKSGNALDSISFFLTNYSSQNYTNQQVTASIYLSQDSVISVSDNLLQQITINNTISANNTIKILSQNITTSALSSGNYWIGLILTGDNNSANNITGFRDACKITVVNTDYVKISGKITSSQSNADISGVALQGLSNVFTDYNGYFAGYVPVGFSGIITPVREGYNFSQSSISVNNVSQPLEYNLTTYKKTYTITLNAKSPVTQTGVWGVQAQDFLNEPITNSSGIISAAVYHGWSGTVYFSKDGWRIDPYTYSFNSVTTNASYNTTAGFRISGYVYDDVGSSIPDVQMQGLPGSVTTNASGYYYSNLDSGWSGTVTPAKTGISFNPGYRNYSNLTYTADYQDYQQISLVYANLKIFLSGAYYENSDSMRCTIKQRNYFPTTPPETLSSSNNAFIFKPHKDFTYTGNEQRVVDWVVIEVLDSRDYTPVDTIAAVLRYDGKLLNCDGSTSIPLDYGISPGYYYFIIRHRNHVAVMSNYESYLYKNSELYDFTSSIEMFYGNEAKLLKTGLYGMFTGDADFDGHIDIDDYNLYNNSSITADHGYKICDYNLDGYVTSYDFILLAPNKKLAIRTKIPELSKKLSRK